MVVKRLPPEEFRFLVEHGILSSIDLIVFNSEGKVLVGERKNKPAQGYLFIPGGVMLHDETWDMALKRIGLAEIGIGLERKDVSFLGTYEQMYPDNFTGRDFSTHYHAKGVNYKLNALDLSNPQVFNDQHKTHVWLSIPELLKNPKVHEHTKNYFIQNVKSRIDV